jgi:hypothetical protein
MASIKISDLRPSDFDLLGDSESFLDDLSDNDLATINGGRQDPITVTIEKTDDNGNPVTVTFQI